MRVYCVRECSLHLASRVFWQLFHTPALESGVWKWPWIACYQGQSSLAQCIWGTTSLQFWERENRLDMHRVLIASASEMIGKMMIMANGRSALPVLPQQMIQILVHMHTRRNLRKTHAYMPKENVTTKTETSHLVIYLTHLYLSHNDTENTYTGDMKWFIFRL